MVVKKQGKKYAVKHCKGKDKGKTIATHRTKKKAMKQHKAIMANKRRQ